MDILLDNILICLFGTAFGWKVKDSSQNLSTSRVVALSLQLHSAKLQLRGTSTSSTKNFVTESIKPTTQAHLSSTRLLPHEWQGWVRIQTLINLAVLNQHNMTWTKTHSKFSIQRSEIKSFSKPTGNMGLLRPSALLDHHSSQWYIRVQWENSKQLLQFSTLRPKLSLCSHR